MAFSSVAAISLRRAMGSGRSWAGIWGRRPYVLVSSCTVWVASRYVLSRSPIRRRERESSYGAVSTLAEQRNIHRGVMAYTWEVLAVVEEVVHCPRSIARHCRNNIYAPYLWLARLGSARAGAPALRVHYSPWRIAGRCCAAVGEGC
jgi:hypothetical protein